MYIFFIFSTLILGIMAFLNSLFLINIFHQIKKYKWWIFGFFYFFLILFFISMGIGRFYEINFISIPYKIGAFSLGAAYLSLFVLTPFYIFKKFYKKDFNIYLQIFAGILLFSINFLGIFNAYSYKVLEYYIKTEKTTELKGKTFILIADTHYGNIFGENQAKRLVKKLNSLQADAILIAGDFFDGPKIDYQKIGEIWNDINKPTFFAAGNHEEYGDFYAMISAVDNDKILVLNNQKTDFFDGNIIGVTYSENKDEKYFLQNLKNIGIDEEKFNILIKHEPKDIESAMKNGIDLNVSGHSHKGQMWPFSMITEKIYGEYFYGLVEKNGKYSFTTSGVGSWGPPQRFGSRSEIIVLKIE